MPFPMKLGFFFSLVQASALTVTYPSEASKVSPTPLDKLAGDAQLASLRALAPASDARSASHEVGARLAAEASARSLQTAAAAGSSIAQRSVTIQNAATAAQQSFGHRAECTLSPTTAKFRIRDSGPFFFLSQSQFIRKRCFFF